jgi:hypothetical protein
MRGQDRKEIAYVETTIRDDKVLVLTLHMKGHTKKGSESKRSN